MKNSHSFTELTYHLVLVPKYRKEFPNNDASLAVLGGYLYLLNCELIEIGGSKDHVHILFEAKPNVAISDIVCKLKAKSSHAFKKEYPFWNGWANGYYCATVGKSSISKITNYIQNQNQ
jgi:putative transposase